MSLASKKILQIGLILLPVLLFLLFFFRFALNVPFEDDLGIMYALIDLLPKATTIQDKIAPFVLAHNEHPIAIYRFFLWLHHTLFQVYDYKIIALVGNVILISSLFFFYRLLKSIQLPLLWLIPIPFIFLSLYIHENALWALCAFQHNAIMGIYFWGLYWCIVKETPGYRFFFGLFLLACTALSSGNGLIAFVIVIGILLFEKRWKNAIITILFFGITKLLFLKNNYYLEPNSFSEIIKGVLLLSGSIVKVSTKNILVMGAGVFISLTVLIYGLKVLLHQIEPSLRIYYLMVLGIALFCLGTFLGIAVYREISDANFSDRYRIYTQMLWISVYLLLIPWLTRLDFRKIFAYGSIGISMLYYIHSVVVEYPFFTFTYHRHWLVPINYRYADSNLNGCYYREFFDKILAQMEHEKTYQLPKTEINPNQIIPTSTKIALTYKKLSDNIIYFTSEFGHVFGIPEKNAIFLVLQDDLGKRFLLPVMHKRNSFSEIITTRQLLKDGFELIIEKGCLPDKIYQVMLLSQTDGKSKLYQTDYRLDTKTLQIVQ